MSITAKRRRWPWVIATVLLLLIGGTIGWRYRPLSARERGLVGTWHSRNREQLILSADRRYDFRSTSSAWFVPSKGDWRISGGELILRSRFEMPLRWDTLDWHLRDFAFPPVFAQRIQFKKPDVIELDGWEYSRHPAPVAEVSGFDGFSLPSP